MAASRLDARLQGVGALRGDGLLDGLLAGRQFLDAAGGERDDGMVGVVVLLQSQGLAVEAALHVALLMAQPLKLGAWSLSASSAASSRV